MAGNHSGGRKSAITNKQKWGPDFYAKIGAAGGKKSRTGGFYARRDVASFAGSIGGKLSKTKQRLIGYEKDGTPIHMKNNS